MSSSSQYAAADLAQRHASPQRQKHQISRSISELPGPIQRLHRHHHSVPHHYYRGHPRGSEDNSLSISYSSNDNHSSSRPPTAHPQSGNPAVLSPAQAQALTAHHQISTGRASLDGGPRSEVATPNMSPIPSRRASILVSGDEGPVAMRLHGATGAGRLARDDEENLTAEKEKTEATAASLKTAVEDLSTFSSATTQRLSEAYSSILEKLGVIQGTAEALRELSGMWQEMNESFGREADDMMGEVSSQLESLGRLDGQMRRIESLQMRIHEGRERIQSLSDRIDVVRERIEGWERADREWQERTRRRLKAGWVVMSVVALVVVVVLLVSASYAPPPPATGTVDEEGLEVAAAAGAAAPVAPWSPEDGGPKSVDGGKGGGGEGLSRAVGGLARLLQSVNQTDEAPGSEGADERFRIFDEL